MNKLNAIATPHLPRGRVGLILIGGRYREKLETPLLSMGCEVVWLPDDPAVDPRLAAHADLSAIHMGGSRVVVSENAASIVNDLTNRGFEINAAKSPQKAEYPLDCGLNGCIVGRRFIHNMKYTDEAVKGWLPEQTEIVSVRQGYSKCSVCVVDANSIITSDAGIAEKAALHGIDALLIRPGFIELAGFDTGFIGGASFKLSDKELAFTGTLDGHPDKERIMEFIRERGIAPLFLTQDPIFDIGSAIPLLER